MKGRNKVTVSEETQIKQAGMT